MEIPRTFGLGVKTTTGFKKEDLRSALEYKSVLLLQYCYLISILKAKKRKWYELDISRQQRHCRNKRDFWKQKKGIYWGRRDTLLRKRVQNDNKITYNLAGEKEPEKWIFSLFIFVFAT